MDEPKARFTKKQYEAHTKTARERLDNLLSDESRLRTQSKNDRRFLIGDSENGFQWDAQILNDRRSADKPCLTINKTKNHFSLIVNSARQNPPAARILPVDGGADVKAAEWMGGLVRNIEAQCQAEKAYITAYKNAVAGGEGYWWVTYDYESPDSFSYQINIREIMDPDTVVIDPEHDPLKRRWGFVFEDMPKAEFKDKYGIDPVSWMGYEQTAWNTEKTVRVANYYWREDKEDTLLLLQDGTTAWLSDGDQPAVSKRKSTRHVWHAWVLGGEHPEPLEESIWPGQWLPIVRLVGEEWTIEGIKHRKGHIRDLKDPARMYNYWSSEATTQVALQNHSPYIGPAEAFAGYEKLWNNANKRTSAWLPFNAFTEDGQAIPSPQKQSPAQMSTALVQGMEIAASEFSMASGQYEAQFGARSNETSGLAINSRKAQSETSTYHFADELALAVVYSTRLVVDLIQKLYDIKKVVRILGIDRKESFVEIDPTISTVSQEQEDVLGEVKKLFNPSLGKYDVVISTGPSFQTQREAAAANLSELSRSMPILGQAAPDLIIAGHDFPNADKIAERLKRSLPPQLTEGEGDGQGKAMGKLQAGMQQAQMQMQQMQEALQQRDQMLQQASQAIQEREQELQALKAKEADKSLEVAIKQKEFELKDRELDIKERDQQLKLQTEQIKAQGMERSAMIANHAAIVQAASANKQPKLTEEGAPEPEDMGYLMQDPHEMQEESQEVKALEMVASALAQISAPKRSIIRIEKQPDGSYSGEKIEIAQDETPAHENAETPAFEQGEE